MDEAGAVSWWTAALHVGGDPFFNSRPEIRRNGGAPRKMPAITHSVILQRMTA